MGGLRKKDDKIIAGEQAHGMGKLLESDCETGWSRN